MDEGEVEEETTDSSDLPNCQLNLFTANNVGDSNDGFKVSQFEISLENISTVLKLLRGKIGL